DLPNFNIAPGVRDEPLRRSIYLELVTHPDRSVDNGFRWRIPAGCSIKNQYLPAATSAGDRHQQQVVDRIHADARDITASRVLLTERQLGIVAAENAFRQDIPGRHAIERQNGLIRSSKQDFIIHGVDAYFAGRAHTFDLGLVPLDDAKGSFLSIGGSAERQDR